MVECERVLVQDLAGPLHAGHRERLRLHLVAPVLDGARPALLIREHGDRDHCGKRRQDHRQDHGAAALATVRHRSASHRSTLVPSSCASTTRTARGRSGSPSTGQRSRHPPCESR